MKFQVGKKYKFNMGMVEDFLDDHSCNNEVLAELKELGYVITVVNIAGNDVDYGGYYLVYKQDSRFFTEVEDVTQEITMINKSESEIVKAWFDKMEWLLDNTPIKLYTNLELIIENGESLYNVDCVEFVINSYEAYQNKAKQQQKQLLLDKKKALELELAQINEQLEG
jgi:hypothetical protein